MTQEKDNTVVELRVIQSSVGSFNWANPSEKSFSFTIGLFGADRQLIVENGVKAVLHFSGDPDTENEFDEPLDNLRDVFDKCFKYSKRVWGSTDYEAQCLLFARIYTENYEALDNALVASHKQRVEKKIAELQKQLSWNNIIPEISDVVDECIDTEVKKYNTWIDMNKKELEQLKEDAPKYAELQKKNEGHQSKINSLQSLKTITNGNQ